MIDFTGLQGMFIELLIFLQLSSKFHFGTFSLINECNPCSELLINVVAILQKSDVLPYMFKIQPPTKRFKKRFFVHVLLSGEDFPSSVTIFCWTIYCPQVRMLFQVGTDVCCVSLFLLTALPKKKSGILARPRCCIQQDKQVHSFAQFLKPMPDPFLTLPHTVGPGDPGNRVKGVRNSQVFTSRNLTDKTELYLINPVKYRPCLGSFTMKEGFCSTLVYGMTLILVSGSFSFLPSFGLKHKRNNMKPQLCRNNTQVER